MSRHHYKKKSSGKLVLFLISLILAVYLVNFSFNFIKFPGFFSEIHNWILLISGIFLFLGSFNFLKSGRRH